MKKILAILLLLSCAVFPACTGDSETTTAADTTAPVTEADTTVAETEAPVKKTYYVRTPEQPPEEELQTKVYTYDNYDEAYAYATKLNVAVLGYAVYDEDGNFLGGKYSELVTNLMYNGKHVADYVRMNNYKYGNASINPVITYWRRTDPRKYGRENGEKLVSCDRLVDWILYDTGFTDQPTTMGMHINAYMDPTHGMMGWCIAQGFEKITDPDDLQAGDLVFTNPKDGDPNFGKHVYMFAGDSPQHERGLYYRYDGGADDRLMCNGRFQAYSRSGQPFVEPVGSFVVGYRPVESALKEPLGGKK